jgi:hypothetical protein
MGLFRRKPRVAWSRVCPRCRCADAVRVRTTAGALKFYYCRLACGWACWRPPAGVDCQTCQSAMLWSCSRKSVGCPACGLRVRTDGTVADVQLLGTNPRHSPYTTPH